MKKIVMLIPCLMLENNREANLKSMKLAKENYPVDEFVVYDQEFKKEDYLEGFTYIGHQEKRQGFIEPRNSLIRWFYKSDYDYAIWMDANEFLSKPSINDFTTLINYLRYNDNVDVIMTSMGIQVDANRMELKQKEDYLDTVHLIPINKGYRWFHFMFMKNFWKYYHVAPHLDKRCNPHEGLGEDEYFGFLMHRMFQCYCAPTICSCKPSNKTSTWQNEKDSYDYPKTQQEVLQEMVYLNHVEVYKNFQHRNNVGEIIIPRLDDKWKPFVKPYKSRSKKNQDYQLDLFDF